MEMIHTMGRKSRRSFMDDSSDALRAGEPGAGTLILRGLRRAPSGSIFVTMVCVVIAAVAFVAHNQ